MSLRVELRPAAARFIRKLRDGSLSRRLVQELRKLSKNPRPPGSIKMVGPEGFHRVRVGDFRIIYQIHDGMLLVVVVQIGHRRDI